MKLTLQDLYDLDAGLAESIRYYEQDEVVDIEVVTRLQTLRCKLNTEMSHISSVLDDENLKKTC